MSFSTLFFNSYVFTQVISIPTFTRTIDSAGDDQGLSIACDSSGNVYISGYYTGTPVVSTQVGGTIDILPTSSGIAVFVCKFDSTGTYQYSRIVDAAGTDSGQGVTCDSSGNVYLTGYYTGTPTVKNQAGTALTAAVAPTVSTLPASTSSAVFVCKFDSSGTYQYSRIVDSAGFDAGQGVACDSSGNMYVSGRYAGTPTIKNQGGTSLATLPVSSVDAAFLSKFDSTGTYQYSRIVDSTGSEIGYSVTCDSSGNVYLAGYYTGTPTVKNQAGTALTAAIAPLVSTLPAPSSESVFVSKFSSTGTYQYSRVIDGTGAERGFSVACDSSENVYIAGNYNGTPTVKNQGGGALTAAVAPTVSTLPTSTGEAAFVSKFDSAGTYQYSRTLDGSGNEFAWGVACDSSDNMYITGQYNGTPTVKNQGNGTLASLTAPTNYGGYLIKFNSSGAFQTNVFIDASSDDRGYGIACDSSSGSVYFTGYYNGTSASVKNQGGTSMGTIPSTVGNSAFLVKFDSSLNYAPTAQNYSTFSRVIDGASTDIGYGVATDSMSNVYIVGEYSGTPIIKDHTGATIDTLIASSGVTAFVSKFTLNGAYQFTRLIDSSTTADRGYSVACDSSGNVYLAGQYSGTPNIKDGDSGSTLDSLPASTGGFSAFLCKFDASGTFQYARTVDSTGADTSQSVACDSSGNVYLAGQYSGTPTIRDQDGNVLTAAVAPTVSTLPASSGVAAFLCKFDSTGTYQYSRIIDSAGTDIGYAIACDSSGNVYLTGQYSGTPTIANQGGTPLTAAIAPLVSTLPASVGIASFVSKFDSTGTYQYSRIVDSAGTDIGYAVTCDSLGNMYISGEYNGTPTITNQGGTSLGTLPASTSIAGFACKFDSTGTYQYSRIVDGTGFEVGFSVACDSSNNVYLAGSYQGTPTIKNQAGTTLGALPTDAGTRAAFVSKFDSSGNYKYSRIVDTVGEDRTRFVACDPTNNVYIAGQYQGTPTIKNQIGASMGTLPASTNSGAFLVKFNADGGYFVVP